MPANRIAAAEVALDEGLVDDRRAVGPALLALGRRARVERSERAAAHDRRAKRLEVAGAHAVHHGAGALAGLGREAFDGEGHAPAAALQDAEQGETGGVDARQRLQPLVQGAGELLAARVRVAAALEIDRERRDLAGDEARVHAQQVVQAADEQAGGGQHQEGERDLDDDQRLAQARLLADHAAAGRLQGGRHAALRGAQRRRQPRHEGREDRDRGREGDHAQVG